MNIILLTKNKGNKINLTLGRRSLAALAVVLLLVLPATTIALGYLWGQQYGVMPPEDLHGLWSREQASQQQELEKIRQDASDGLNALAVHVGQLQAYVIRLDALGQRLTEMAKLDRGEFDFSSVPAQGGPEDPSAAYQSVKVNDFLLSVDDLMRKLDDRGRQLEVLEGLMMNRNLQQEISPAGRPIMSGWISSHFGMRTDPFTGKQEFHEGMDFAGKEGSGVVAVAAGVVTWAGSRYGYGELVEINHGNGYVTRYGHNKEIHVTEGQAVKKGEVLAAMGSSGRSTGPHVHFEVLYNGRPVNPSKYIQAAN